MGKDGPAVIRVLLTILLLSGCGPNVAVVGRDYLTIDHEFTDKAAEQAAIRAQALCAQKKQAVEKVSSACSLKRCTTNYQCVEPASTPAK